MLETLPLDFCITNLRQGTDIAELLGEMADCPMRYQLSSPVLHMRKLKVGGFRTSSEITVDKWQSWS